MSDEFKYNPLTNDMDLVGDGGGGGGGIIPAGAVEDNLPAFGDNNNLTDSGINKDAVLLRHYGICDTAANVAAKTVEVDSSFFPVMTGVPVYVKFTNANTASNPTLTVGNFSAYPIYANGVQITDGPSKGLLKGVCEFIYIESAWSLIGNSAESTGDVTPVIEASLCELNGEIEAIDPNEAGDLHCSTVDMDNLPKVCGYPQVYFGAAAPARTPDFIGQFYISGWSYNDEGVLVASGSAIHVYIAVGVTNASSYLRLDN